MGQKFITRDFFTTTPNFFLLKEDFRSNTLGELFHVSFVSFLMHPLSPWVDSWPELTLDLPCSHHQASPQHTHYCDMKDPFVLMDDLMILIEDLSSNSSLETSAIFYLIGEWRCLQFRLTRFTPSWTTTSKPRWDMQCSFGSQESHCLKNLLEFTMRSWQFQFLTGSRLVFIKCHD